jgi:hypothetical protein
MPPYFTHQSAFRSLALGVSAAAAAPTITALIHFTGWLMPWWSYVILSVGIYTFYCFLIYQSIGPINRILINIFASEELKEREKAVALEVVKTLFDGKKSIELPVNQDDLIAREASLNLRKYFTSTED